MGKNNKKRPKIPDAASKAPASQVPIPIVVKDPGCFIFIFSLLNQDHRKYCCRGQRGEFFNYLLNNLRKLSTTKIIDIKYERDNFFHFHPINWEAAGFIEGFSALPKDYRDYPPYQFAVGDPQDKGRVYGFLDEPCFYIVWIDPEHQQYSQKK